MLESECGKFQTFIYAPQYVIHKNSLSFVLNSSSDGQWQPSGVPAGWSMVAHWGQCLGGTLHQAEQARCLWQCHLLSGLDLLSDEGKKDKKI